MLIATAATLSPTFSSISLFLYPKLVSLQLKNGVKMGGQYQSDNAYRRFDLGVNNWQSKVVGVGCDGAAVNDSDIRRLSVYNPNALCGSSLGT